MLKNKINSTSASDLSFEELSFSLLALGYDKEMKEKLFTELKNRKSNGTDCWPKTGCTLKETSLAFLAYNHIDEDTQGIISWLNNQTSKPNELSWYLQIDTNEKTECTLGYDNISRKITINEDKTISGSPGTCFSSSSSGSSLERLEILPICYSKEISISCKSEFLTNLIFKKKSTSTYYVSALTSTGAPGGETKEKVECLCFKQSGSCNYEGSLWASLALQKNDGAIKVYLPYLMTSANENTRVFPSTFLYSLTNFDDYFTEIINQQNTQGYWQIAEVSRRYYDTGIALLSLYNKDSTSTSKAEDYLLSSNVQGNGCFGGSIRDTALILFATNPRTAYSGSNNSGGINPSSLCTDFSGYSCTSKINCENSLNGSVLSNFRCFGSDICCSKKESTKSSCSSLLGEICGSDETCTGSFSQQSSDSRCCINGQCKLEIVSNECEKQGYTCQSNCLSGQEEKAYSCGSNVCCGSETKIEPESSYWWLWLLIILIILIILAIIFRNQLSVFVFKTKNKFSKSPAPVQNRPPMPPTGPQSQMMMPRRIIPNQMMRPGMIPQRRPMPNQGQMGPKVFSKDKELDETLKKIKDMTK